MAVLVIVNGQSTTDDDFDKDESRLVDVVDRLIDVVAELRAQQIKSADKIAKLEDKITKLEDQLTTTSATAPDASKLVQHMAYPPR